MAVGHFVYAVLVQSACWNCGSVAILKFVGVVGVGSGIMHSIVQQRKHVR